MINETGAQIFSPDTRTMSWAEAAARVARDVARVDQMRQQHLRHGGTWFVGVDALPTGEEGAMGAVPLDGLFRGELPPVAGWHPAQLSIVYPGYPGRDVGESETAHGYRLRRGAAHVDGLHAAGPDRRRFPLELHAFVLGVPLNDCGAAPTLYWPGSHRIIGSALCQAVGDRVPREVDVTEAYIAARRRVFDEIAPMPVQAVFGGAFLLHRFTLHGMAPWEGPAPPDGRMVAFFRPEVAAPSQWLRPDWV